MQRLILKQGHTLLAEELGAEVNSSDFQSP